MAAQDGGVFGVRIVSVRIGTRAARAGLISRATGRGGDLIVAVAGHPTTTKFALDQSLRAVGLNSDVELIVYRNGRYLRILVPRRPSSAVASFDRRDSGWAQLVGEAMDRWSPLDRWH